MGYSNFSELVEKCKQNPETKTVAVAGAANEHVLGAIVEAEKIGLVKPVLIGKKAEVEEGLKKLGEDPAAYKIVNAESNEECGVEAVELIKKGEAEFIMKGMVDTKDVLKPLVKKENGLHTGRSMCVFSYNEVPQMTKLMALADGGMIPYPTLEQKKDIVLNCVESLHKLGIENPSVAVLAAVEKVNPKMVETTDAAALVEMNKNGEIPGCEIVGPISFDIMLINMAILLAAGIALLLGAKTAAVAIVLIGLVCTGLSYGGNPTITSAFISRQYGPANFPVNFSIANFSLIPAAIAGPMIASKLITSADGAYDTTFLTIIICGVVAVLLWAALNGAAKKENANK